MTYYRRRTLAWWEEAAAAAAGAAAGLAAAYLTRVWLRREPAEDLPRRRGRSEGDRPAGPGEAGAVGSDPDR